VRTAAIDLNGVGPMNTISPPQDDALLSDLAPGPDGEAIALWREPRRSAGGTLQPSAQAILAARGDDAYPDKTVFAAPELVAPAGPNEDATVALDPASDRAIALWRGAGGAIEYALRDPRGH
jgi:hypothetical protein